MFVVMLCLFCLFFICCVLNVFVVLKMWQLFFFILKFWTGSGISINSSSTNNLIKPLSNFYSIANNYKTFNDLKEGLKLAGLESSELIIGIDFTKSNLYNGLISFNGQSLHALNYKIEKKNNQINQSSNSNPNSSSQFSNSNLPLSSNLNLNNDMNNNNNSIFRNPYEFVLYSICETMSYFDDDNKIPCYGFGDVTTRNQKVFSFKENDEPCHGLEEVEVKIFQFLLILTKLMIHFFIKFLYCRCYIDIYFQIYHWLDQHLLHQL